jgi:hypothetical protein
MQRVGAAGAQVQYACAVGAQGGCSGALQLPRYRLPHPTPHTTSGATTPRTKVRHEEAVGVQIIHAGVVRMCSGWVLRSVAYGQWVLRCNAQVQWVLKCGANAASSYRQPQLTSLQPPPSTGHCGAPFAYLHAHYSPLHPSYPSPAFAHGPSDPTRHQPPLLSSPPPRRTTQTPHPSSAADPVERGEGQCVEPLNSLQVRKSRKPPIAMLSHE